jgi:UDP-N-acetylmuramate dehydrogenase
MTGLLQSPRAARAVAADLARLSIGEVLTDVDLRRHSRWRCGGRAALVAAPDSKEAVSRVLAYFHRHGLRWSVIGGGSNLLFDDRGVRAPLVHIGSKLREVHIDGLTVRAEAGVAVPSLALHMMHAGLSGIEHTVGIPGALGGLVIMNGGSLRRGIGENIVDVEIVAADGALRRIAQEDCAFTYRRSALQDAHCIVVGAQMILTPGDRTVMRKAMLDIMVSRRRRFPRNWPNCGSVFVSDPALYASFGAPGAVIEQCGLKGARIGDAVVSPKHANFIINAGAARAADILALIAQVRADVFARTGHRMRCEVRFMDTHGEVREAHEWVEQMAPHQTVPVEASAS